jgi:hypothetical protein
MPTVAVTSVACPTRHVILVDDSHSVCAHAVLPTDIFASLVTTPKEAPRSVNDVEPVQAMFCALAAGEESPPNVTDTEPLEGLFCIVTPGTEAPNIVTARESL